MVQWLVCFTSLQACAQIPNLGSQYIANLVVHTAFQDDHCISKLGSLKAVNCSNSDVALALTSHPQEAQMPVFPRVLQSLAAGDMLPALSLPYTSITRTLKFI